MNRKRIFRKRIYLNSVTALLARLLVLFAAYAVCRLVFYLYNYESLGPVLKGEWWDIFRGAFIFDSASIFYINIPFILLSVLPYRNRVSVRYQRVLSWVYVVPNAVALMTDVADIFYYGFQHGRITSADISGGGEFVSFLGTAFTEYWWGILLWLGLCGLLYLVSFMLIRVQRRYRLTYNLTSYYISQVVVCVVFVGYGLFAVRGHNAVPGSKTLLAADAGKYVRPDMEQLILSNPFCIINSALKPEQRSTAAETAAGGNELDKIFSGIFYPSENLDESTY